MKATMQIAVTAILALGAWAMLSGILYAETEPIPPQANAEATAPTVAPPQAQTQTLTVEQAFQNLGGAVNGFLTYAPTNEGQRKLVIDSYNTVKAALDRLAVLEAPPKPEETKK
jgi:hypothetical protein